MVATVLNFTAKLIAHNMSKEKEGKAKKDKTEPTKTLKEKRAAKKAKREGKRSIE